MRTKKPFSTISYNSIDFLESKLRSMLDNHFISEYMFIYHYAEKDESKDHIHLYVEPNSLLDTMVFQDALKELDPANPSLPLGCINCHSSKVDDWLLYVLHDPAYLASKAQEREYIYNKEDMRYSDVFTFEDRFNHAYHASEWALKNHTLKMISEQSIAPADLVLKGFVPLNLAPQLNALCNMRERYGTVNRAGRSSHSPKDAESSDS